MRREGGKGKKERKGNAPVRSPDAFQALRIEDVEAKRGAPLDATVSNAPIGAGEAAPRKAADLDIGEAAEAKTLEKKEQAAIDERVIKARPGTAASREDLHELYTRPVGERAIEPSPAAAPAAKENLYESYTRRQREREREETEGPGGIAPAEAGIVPSPDDALDPERAWAMRRAGETERTPAEERGRLRELVGKFAAGPKEKFDWWKSSEEGLVRRSAELDAQTEKMGGIEKGFRWLGEKYNKLGWKTKLAVGLGLGLGYGAALATVSLPAIFACMAGLAAQRTAGLATMYLKYEKDSRLQGSARLKERAMLNAIGYTAFMTAGTMLAVREIEEWVGTMLGHGTPTVPGAPHTATGPTVPAHEIAAPVPPGPEMPPLTIHAAPGHGYEYMLKEMWHQLQEKHLDPSQYGKDSDIHKLLTANDKNINDIVHQIASDPQHGFYHPDGTSVVVHPDDIVAFNAHGQVMLMTPEGAASVHAAAGAHLTSPYHPEAAAVPAAPAEHAAAVPPGTLSPPFEPYGVPVEQAPAPAVEAHVTPVTHPDTGGFVHDGGGNVVHDGEGNPVHGGSYEAPARSASEVRLPHETVTTDHIQSIDLTHGASAEVIQNHFGLSIPTAEAHIYASPEGAHLLVYGGSIEDQAKAIGAFFENPHNARAVVYGTDASGTYRIPYALGPDGQVQVAGEPVRTGGFLGLFSSWMKPPGPEELQRVVK